MCVCVAEDDRSICSIIARSTSHRHYSTARIRCHHRGMAVLKMGRKASTFSSSRSSIAGRRQRSGCGGRSKRRSVAKAADDAAPPPPPPPPTPQEVRIDRTSVSRIKKVVRAMIGMKAALPLIVSDRCSQNLFALLLPSSCELRTNSTCNRSQASLRPSAFSTPSRCRRIARPSLP